MKATLLVVDGEKEVRDKLSGHFGLMDFHVVEAENGKKALDVLAVERVEIVVTELLAPELGGIDLLREITMQYPMTHVIVVTGQMTMENLLAAFRYGADTCVFKPLNDLTELDEAVRDAFRHLTRWQEKLLQVRSLDPGRAGSAS